MIDRLAASFRYLQPLPSEVSYTPDKALLGYAMDNELPDSDMVVVFPFWRQTEGATKRLQQLFRRNQQNSLILQLNPLILNSNPQSVKTSFETIAQQASERINQLTTNGQQRLSLLGISLGNVSLAMTAEKLDHFDDVTMVVPGADLAQSLWDGARTRRLRKSYEAQGYTLDYLRTEWSDLAPINHIEALNGHAVDVMLAKKDLFIPYAQGSKLASAMVGAGVAPNIQTFPGGHVTMLAKYLIGKIDSNR